MHRSFDELYADNNEMLLKTGEEFEKYQSLIDEFIKVVAEAKLYMYGGVQVGNDKVKKDNTIKSDIKFPCLRVV